MIPKFDRAITPQPRVDQRHEVQGPREYPGRVSTNIDADLHLAIERYAERDKVSVSEFVHKALEDYVIGQQEKSGVTPTNDRVLLEIRVRSLSSLG